MHIRHLFPALGLSLLLIGPGSSAQTAPPPLQASNAAGERFAPQQLKGRVTMLFYWSTACAVCRDSLPELRANAKGWRGKPFALVTVNVDRQAEDWLAYERIASQVGGAASAPGATAFFSLRQDASLPAPPKLPLTLLLDAQGREVARFEGRIAPEAWDGVAELLP